MSRLAKLLLGLVAATSLAACGVPIHQHPTVVPKDKIPFHLSDPNGSKRP